MKWKFSGGYWDWTLFGFGIILWTDRGGWDLDELFIQVGFLRLEFFSDSQMVEELPE